MVYMQWATGMQHRINAGAILAVQWQGSMAELGSEYILTGFAASGPILA